MDENSLRYEGWRVAFAGASGVLFASFFFLSFAVFLKPLAAEFGWSREAVSRAYGMMTIASALGAPAIGYLLDRHGPRWVCAPSLAIAAFAFASLWQLTPQLPRLYLTFAAIGLVVMGTGPVVYTRIVSTWFDRRRGVALAVVVSGAGLGGIVHPSLAQAAIDLTGWRTACLLLGGTMAIIGVPIAVAFVRQRAEAAISSRGMADSRVGAALASRTFWTLLAVVFASTLAINGTIVHMQALLTDRGLTAAAGASVGSAMGVASLSGRLLAGWLIDRYDAVRVSFALLCLVAAGVFLLTSDRTALIVFGGLLLGLGAGGELDATPYLLSRYFGIRSMAALYGLVWSAWGIAGALGSIGMGRGFDATGSYDGALTIFAIGTLAAASLTLTLPACVRAPEAVTC